MSVARQRRASACIRATVLMLALAACSKPLAWLLPGLQKDASLSASSRRAALLGAAVASASLGPPSAEAAFDVKMAMSNIRYEEVTCNVEKGEMLKGTKATYGYLPRCVKVTAEVTNPEKQNLKKAGVFGRIFNREDETSVLANSMDGRSDVGQFTLIDNIPPGTNDITFRFVAALTKNYKEKPLPPLEFSQMKASWYPGSLRWEPLSECDLNPTADGCEDAEHFCKDPRLCKTTGYYS